MNIVFSGPSGAGKGTLTEMFLKDNNFKKFTTCTTRKPREGEKNGFDYYFYDKETFLLDSLQIEYFENEYSYEMFDAYAIPFDFTIRLKDIQKDYFMVYSKPEKKVYIILYTKGLFYDKNIDDGIKNIRNQSSIIRKNMNK